VRTNSAKALVLGSAVIVWRPVPPPLSGGRFNIAMAPLIAPCWWLRELRFPRVLAQDSHNESTLPTA
jgi:hypothetical protein